MSVCDLNGGLIPGIEVWAPDRGLDSGLDVGPWDGGLVPGMEG